MKYACKVPLISQQGGFGNGPVPRIDSLGSRMFLLNLKPSLSSITPPHLAALPPKYFRPTKALDAGAGVGRVTSDTLLPLFDRVDLVESSTHFLEKARLNSSRWRGIEDGSKGVRFFQAGLQYCDPSSMKEQLGIAVGAQDFEEGYDVIWIQWVAGHLGHEELVAFLQRCSKALRKSENGEEAYIVVKENVINSNEDMFDETDSSFVRYAVLSLL